MPVSVIIGSVCFQTTCTSASGQKVQVCRGPIRSRGVIPGYASIVIFIRVALIRHKRLVKHARDITVCQILDGFDQLRSASAFNDA